MLTQPGNTRIAQPPKIPYWKCKRKVSRHFVPNWLGLSVYLNDNRHLFFVTLFFFFSLSITFSYFFAQSYFLFDYVEYPVLLLQNFALFLVVVIFDHVPMRKVVPTVVIYVIVTYALAMEILPFTLLTFLTVRAHLHTTKNLPANIRRSLSLSRIFLKYIICESRSTSPKM